VANLFENTASFDRSLLVTCLPVAV